MAVNTVRLVYSFTSVKSSRVSQVHHWGKCDFGFTSWNDCPKSGHIWSPGRFCYSTNIRPISRTYLVCRHRMHNKHRCLQKCMIDSLCNNLTLPTSESCKKISLIITISPFQPNLTVWRRTCACGESLHTFREKLSSGSITSGSRRSAQMRNEPSAVYPVSLREPQVFRFLCRCFPKCCRVYRRWKINC